MKSESPCTYTISLIESPSGPSTGGACDTAEQGGSSSRTGNASFLQSAFWADFKAAHGWKPLSVSLCLKDGQTGAESPFKISVLLRSFKRFFTLAYIPMGPELPLMQNTPPVLYSKVLADTARALKPLLPRNSLCVRMDVPLDFYSLEERGDFVYSISKPLVKAPSDIQPPDTNILDLTLSEDKISANMKSKWRYNINLASKRGVVVEKAGEEGIDIFYDLYLQTAKRDGIAVHAKNYYRDLLLRSGRDGVQITMYIAKHEGEALAAIIVLFSGSEAVYLYGASSNNKRNLMSAYLLQWTAIKDAKKAGCTTYDFYGIPPTDDENHPMHGLYRFKTGFGGKNVHRPGSIDFPLSLLYSLFRAAEKLRGFYHKRIKKIRVKKRNS
ncbi:lipid II:glycine glycyltransferase FemX [Treponema sp. OMZ 840]|uniref:lipid II:glycine glycyltransferase FemX n=1 Tax=Treponema sp. OMZ 840 TaxID=244313 RepID=UPI003D92B700